MLKLARGLIPQREVGKANYTQALDGARIAARVIGPALASAGQISDPEDVFHLTYDELVAGPEGDLRSLVEERRALREDYLTTDLPDKWTGPPTRVPIDAQPANGALRRRRGRG